MESTGVRIEGTGLVTCLGEGAAAVFDCMCDGVCGIRPIDRFPAECFAQSCGGQIPPDLEDRLRGEYPDADLAVAMIHTAAEEALLSARGGQERAAVDTDDRFGLVLGSNFGPMESLEWCWRERLDEGTMDERTFCQWRDIVPSIARAFGCGGPSVQLSLSCASGAAALALGKQWIETGRADRVLVVAYDTLTEFCWAGLSNLRTITSDMIRPFDQRRAGTIFSEGAAAAVIAKPQRGNETSDVGIRLAGAAMNNNAFHLTAPAKEGDGSRRVMKAALDDAGLAPECVTHISAHATGTAANDKTEAEAFRNVFGDRLDKMSVAAHKAQIGHMMGAAGLAEAVLTAEVLRQGRVPPIVNHGEKDPECPVPVHTSLIATSARCAITNSAGIGGNNASLVLVKEDAPEGNEMRRYRKRCP